MSAWLPYEKLIYRTILTPEQVIAELKENLETPKSFGFNIRNYSYSKPYIGFAAASRFEIQRAANYFNSFLPQIKGEVNGNNDITNVKVTMKPDTFVLFFMAIWFCGVVVAGIAAVSELISKGFNVFLLLPVGMAIFGITLFYGAFKTESTKSKKDLQKIFKAEIVDL